MHILMAIKGLAVEGGGAERVFAQLAGGLVGRGHEVQIVTFDAPSALTYYNIPDEVGRLGLDISPVGQPTSRSALPRGMLALRREVRRSRPDVVVAFMHSTYVPVALALVGLGVPVIASEHTSRAHFRDKGLQRRLVDLATAMSACKTVLSTKDRAEEKHSSIGKTVVMPNPIDMELFSPQEASVSLSRILAVGRFRAEKDFPTLIEAFSRVAANFPDWELRIIGEGSELPALEAAIASSGYGNRIALPGGTKDVVSQYHEACFLAVPSRYEGFGLVTAEALACGRAVIGFGDCIGTAALIRDGQNGLLIEPETDRVAALAAGLGRLMSDRDFISRLGQAGPDSVSHLALDQIIDQWEVLLGRVIKEDSHKKSAVIRTVFIAVMGQFKKGD